MQNKLETIQADLQRLAKLDELTDAQQVEWDTAEEAFEAEVVRAEKYAARQHAVERATSFSSTVTEAVATEEVTADFIGEPESVDTFRGKNPWDVGDLRRTGNDELVARATSAIEHLTGASDATRSRMTDLVEGTATLQEGDESDMARMVLATTSPDYLRSFSRYLSGGPDSLTDADKIALGKAKGIQRAMSTTDGSGGYLIPMHIEPAVVMTAAGVSNPFFELGRVIPTTSDTLRAVGSGNAAWSWDSENAEVSDDATTFTNTDIALHMARGFVPVSIEAMQSIGNVAQVVQDVLMAGHADLLSAALTTGTGSSQPFGIVTAVTAEATASATTDVFAVADVYNIFEALPAKYRRNATWASNIAALSDIRQFATDDGHSLLARIGEGEGGTRIFGRPWREASDMDGAINATATNLYLLFGDFSNYWIAQGLGTTVEYVPQVTGTTGRPIGARGWFAYHRFGADSVNDSAFELLDVT